MLATGLRQLRYGYSLLTGRRFSADGLQKIVADLVETLDEFGETTDEAAEMLMVAEPDAKAEQEVVGARLRQAVRDAATSTAYYREWFGRHDIDVDDLPITTKAQLKSAPFAFVSDRSQPVLMAQTTGTTGVPASIWFSRYELDVLSCLNALAEMLAGLRRHHVVANFGSSRAALPVYDLMRTSTLVGNGCLQVGIVDPRIAIERLATPLHLPGKANQVTHMVANASFLAAVVQEVEQGAWKAADFGLRQIFPGGEILTEALRLRAEEALGAPVLETYAATEITPIAGRVCSQRHMHFATHQGQIEVLDPMTHRPVAPGEIGVLVVTPYPPFRDTTLLIRYETGDLVRRLATDKLSCELANVFATSQVLGRADTLAGPLAREVLEILQTEPAIPLPTRYALVPGRSGPVLHVAVPRPSRRLVSRLEELIAQTLPGLDGLVLTDDPDSLPSPCVVRADLREHSFELSALVPAAADPAPVEPESDLLGALA
jgi:phenylacetate-coenzyme A ligase PaaK-like adenylate-forming protein